MADKTIYKFPEVKKKILDVGYKHCKLVDSEGSNIINYNPVKKPIKGKLEEIEKRIKHLSPGVYCVYCQTQYGTKQATDKYYIGVGKYDPKSISEEGGEDLPEKGKNKKETVKESGNVLSVESAMENIRELSEAKSEVLRLKAEVQRLERKVEDLETELEEEGVDEEESSGGLEGFGKVMKEFAPVFESIADRHYKLKERDLKFKETKFLEEHGYDTGLPKKKLNGSSGKKKPKPIPEVDGEGWDEYLEHLNGLDDPTLEEHLAQIKDSHPDVYEAVMEELYEEEGEEGED